MRFLSPKVIVVSGLQIALTAILLVALVRLLDPTKLRQLLHAVDPAWLTLSFVILITQQIIAAERWRVVGRALMVPPHTFSFYLFWQGLGMLCSMALPSFIGADLARGYALSRRTAIGTVVRTVLIDRALGLLSLASLVVVALIVLPLFFIANPLLLLPVSIAISGGVIYVVLTRWLPTINGTGKLILASRQLGSDLRATVEGDGSSRVVLTSLSIHILSVVAFFALGQAVGIAGIDPVHYLAIVSCGLLETIFPISVGGWGIRESALVIGFGSCRSSLRGLLRCRPRSGYWQCCPRVSLRCLASPTSFRSQSTILLKHRRSRPNLEANSLLAELSLYSLNSLPAVG